MDSWFGVEVRHLSALVALDEERSFRGAADRLGYVQSAVSQQIAQLERIVGSRLVDRARGHAEVALTEAGGLMLVHANRILAELTAAEANLRAVQMEEGATEMTLGVFGSAATRVLPAVLALLTTREHELRVRTRETLGDADLFALVERGEVDAAFAELPVASDAFVTQTLFVDPTVLLVQADSPLARQGRAPTLPEIASLPLIADRTWRLLPEIEAAFRTAGHALEFPWSSSTNAATHALVGAGLGAALIPALAADVTNPGTAVINLGSLLPARTIVLFWHGRSSNVAAIRRLVHVVSLACRQLARAGEEQLAQPEPIVHQELDAA